MNTILVTLARTVGRARSLSSTALAIGGFLAASALLFALGLEKAEGGPMSLAAVWTAGVSPVLPILAAVLSMDVWSDERLSNRIDTLLSAPVRERDIVLGKFLGVWTVSMIATLASLLMCTLLLRYIEPASLANVGFFSFVLGLLALAAQSLLWCAISVVMSALFRHAAAAACMSVAVTCGLPRGLWAAAIAWAPQGGFSYGEMPLDAHAVDIASGAIPLGVLVSYLALSAIMLFVCTKLVESMRLVGHGAAKARFSTGLAVALALVLGGMFVTLALRLDIVVDLPDGAESSGLSRRTRGILSETSGEIRATCFLPRNDSRFRPVGHMLRSLRREATANGGASIELRYVDPRWNLGEAQRLVRSGIQSDSVVFEKGRRRLTVSLSDGFSERLFASAILKLTTPQQRTAIYWTDGHGEISFSDYSALGLSDIARELSRDGFHNHLLNFSDGTQMPSDCALVVVAGAKEDFSRTGLDRLNSYLKQGGRLLVLLEEDSDGGLTSLLSSWGVRLSAEKPTGAKTISGSDVVVPVQLEHSITSPLSGTQVVMEDPVSLEPSAVSADLSADGVAFSELLRAGGRCLAAAVERGNDVGVDLAIRPTKIVVVGDSLLVANGQLASHGNANRDFFLNCVAYLAGTGAVMSGGEDVGRLVTGLDRNSRLRFVQWAVGIVPFCVFLLLIVHVQLRRRRS